MNRIAWLLLGLTGVLLVALFFLFVFQPNREELAEVEERIALQEQQQQQLEAEINRLRSVREDAPELEAELAAAETIVPRDPSLPALLRQLQLAADESGVQIDSVGVGRPAPVPDQPIADLASLDLTVQLVGGYFPVIDFLRRIEEPNITSRGVLWSDVTVSRDEEAYPDLQFTLAGNSFVTIEPEVVDEPATPSGEDGDTETDEGTDDDGAAGADAEEVEP